jgi:hypothetical protein
MSATGLFCERCGEPIGVYEPIWWQRPDGSIIASGYLPVMSEPDSRHPASCYYHRDCLPTPRVI